MSAECEETNYRILMLGRTGSGKNTIKDRILRNSTLYSKETVRSIVSEGKIRVVDTLFDTCEDVRKTAQVIQGSLKLLSPGPHVFLVVLENGVDAEEERRTLMNLNIILGPQFVSHAIIILTHTNRMKDIKETSQEPKGLKIFCDSCRRQIIAINNMNNNSETIKRQREKLCFSVRELSDNGMRYYHYNISINIDCPKGLTIERSDSCWNTREISEKDVNDKKILEINTMRYKQENVFMQLINDELKTTHETKPWETVANAACKFMHAALASSMKHPVSKMGDASTILSASIKSTENLIDDDEAEPDSFANKLNQLILHLQSCMKKTLKKKCSECMSLLMEGAYPSTIIEAVKEIFDAKCASNWESCFHKSNSIVQLIETFPEKELPGKEEVLMYVYSYFCPMFVEIGEFSMAIAKPDENLIHHEDWMRAVEKLLKTLPEDKYQYEAALLYFEMSIRNITYCKSPEKVKYFKDKFMSSVRKHQDPELHLYYIAMFALEEWKTSGLDYGPARKREYFRRIAFSMELSKQLAINMEDTVGNVIRTVLQEADILCKRPYVQDITCWRNKRTTKVFGPNGPSLKQSKLAGAIQGGDDNYVKQFLKNKKCEDEELILCLNYYLELYQRKGNQILVKTFLPWICNECVEVHKPCKVYVWAASISKDTDVYGIPVLVCNYREVVDKKFKDNFFFGLPVVYQEYNTANEEEISVQSSKIFLESILNPKEAMQANEIISVNTDWLMTNHSNLQVIKACPLRIRCLEVIKEVCIVLYCRMKGFIPFGEKPFPKTLSASAKWLPVDVREGFYIPAMLQENNDVINTEIPWDHHLFRMGFSVGPHDKHVSATVGPFVQLEGNNVGFLTCAHAFGVPNNIRDAIGTRVVHPANGEFVPVNPFPPDNLICGHVVNIAFDTADTHPMNPVNVDAALIQLNPDNVPHIGRFAWMNPRGLDAAGLNVGQSLRFDHGGIIMKDDVLEILSQPGRIIKVGAESGVTSSNLLDPVRAVIRFCEAELLHEHGNIFPPIIGGIRSYVMRGQYLVRSSTRNAFLATGDSGSGVFFMDEVKNIRCFGIAIGFLPYTFEAVVTPIEYVLRAFNLDERALMRFDLQYIYRRENR